MANRPGEPTNSRVLTVGLTGGLASGKSFVGRELASLGCYLIQADELGHRVIEPGAEAYDAVVREFGTDIVSAEGLIDRRALADMVFSNPQQLEKLNALVHPAVRVRTRALLDEFAATHPSGIAVIEAAILIETGSFRQYERIIVAVCREEKQIERAMARDHITREQALERMSRQMPLEQKIRFANYTIDTSGTKEHTVEQTREVYQKLIKLV